MCITNLCVRIPPIIPYGFALVALGVIDDLKVGISVWLTGKNRLSYLEIGPGLYVASQKSRLPKYPDRSRLNPFRIAVTTSLTFSRSDLNNLMPSGLLALSDMSLANFCWSLRSVIFGSSVDMLITRGVQVLGTRRANLARY